MPRLVHALDRQTVELRLADENRRSPPERLTRALAELAHLPGVSHRFQAEHRGEVAHLGECGKRLSRHALCGRVGRDPLGMLALHRFEPAVELVVLRVGNLRIVLDVVAPVVMLDLLPQLLVLGFRGHGPVQKCNPASRIKKPKHKVTKATKLPHEAFSCQPL